jgi:hypothetical protein
MRHHGALLHNICGLGLTIMSGGPLWLCLGLRALPGSALVHWPAWGAGLRVLMLGPYLEICVICVC